MLVLGDAHAADQSKRRALYAAYDAANADYALQLGDLMHYDLPIPTYFVAGNNEDFDVIDALRAGEPTDRARNATLLASTMVERDGLRIAGLSGNYAPTQYGKSRSELAGDRRRHFVEADVERAKALDDVDVFLVHEAPHGVRVTEEYQVGCQYVDEILRELDPDLCLLGHHHEHAEGVHAGTRVVSLAPAWESYYTLDPDTLELERYATPSD